MKDCIIVCGYPTDKNGELSDILKSRIEKGIELYHQKKAEYLLLSGGAIHNEFCEAIAMKEYAIANGVDIKHIFIDTQAKSTYHNMFYGKQIMNLNGFKSCYLVSNSWHEFKVKYYARKFDLDFEFICANRPKSISFFKAILLKLDVLIHMFFMRLKGYK